MADDAEKPAKKKAAPKKKAAAPAEKAAVEKTTDKADKAEKAPKKKTATAKKTTAKKKPAAEKKPAKGKKAKAAKEEEEEDTGPDAGEGKPGGKALVIVESPAKAKTINKYLGKDYVVKASFGHVRDLPEKGGGLGVDIEKRFEPVYKLLSEKKKVVTELKKAARESDKIFLACDNDREGEAIAWHISEILRAKPERVSRITFNEITKTAIERAIQQPRDIDMAKVNAQQARRILDRIVGYKLSPILWKKVKRGLSAGRVQSVAVRLVVEREREIKAFVPIEYWDLEALFAKLDAPPAPPPPPPAAEVDEDGEPLAKGEKKEPAVRHLGPGRFFAKLVQVGEEKLDPEKFRVKSAEEAAALKRDLDTQPFVVSSVKKTERRDNPSAPFITSTLQQQASTRLRFATNKTMRVAQSLYEGVELGEEGAVGLITYMRTDSTNLAKEAIEEARSFIEEKYGKSYLPDAPPVYKSKAGAQEAHEAIRPTSAMRSPESVEKFLTADQFRLYKLIWERFIACQMPAAIFSQTTVEVTAGKCLFRANGRTLIFDGHLKVTGVKKDEPILPDLAEQERLNAEKLQESQHFTQPPARYTEASLVKALEEKGIGRPSTYASIISTIQDREYVRQENRRLFATELGMIVTDKLAKHFNEIMDEGFTADMETRLDKIEDEKVDWKKVLEDFYGPFEKDVAAADKAMIGLNEEPEESETPCPKCGRLMVKMWNKSQFTRFLGCPGYKTDECKETMPLDEKGAPAPPEETDETCPECGSSMVIRTGRRGRFLACSAYPSCKVTRELADDGQAQLMPTLEATCPLCQKKMVVRRGRRGPFLGCTGYPECKSTLPIVNDPETGLPKAGEKSAAAAAMPQVDIKCEKCGAQMLIRRSRRGPFLGCSKYPKCRGTAQLPDDVKDKLPKPPAPKELGEECDKCGKPLVIKFGRRGPFAACSGYPECKNTKPLPAGTA